MAWSFADEIHALSGFDADDGSGTAISGEVHTVHTNQWLTDGAKEVISQLPRPLLRLCSTISSNFTSTAIGSESETLNTGKVLTVFAGNYEARKIPSSKKHQANSSTSVEYATSTDPVYYIEGNKINILPSSTGSCNYEEVQYPTVAHSEDSIAIFPDEAEHLVVLYAAIKATEYMMLTEEDQEVYAPQLATLKQDYAQGLAALKGGGQ